MLVVVCRCGFFAVLQKLNSEGRQKPSTKHERTKMKFELFGVWVAQGLLRIRVATLIDFDLGPFLDQGSDPNRF